MKRSNASKTNTGKTTASAGSVDGVSTKKSATKSSSIPALDIQREVKPATDEIRRRAYEIYLERMHRGDPGSPESDWGRAEVELRRR
jgi:hypothetical protein